MAYRRKQTPTRVSTLDELRSGDAVPSSPATAAGSSATESLAAQAIRASAAHRDASSISSAYGEPAVSSPRRPQRPIRQDDRLDPTSYDYTSMKNLNESKYGFWGTLARKAKAFIEDDSINKQHQSSGSETMVAPFDDKRFHQSKSFESYRRTETGLKSPAAIASSLNYIGGSLKNAIEEGLTIVENKTADIIHETRKLNLRKKESNTSLQDISSGKLIQQNLPQIQTDYETQLKASRDVANAMAAKSKLLLREIKTVKADLAFAKERCSQLEEENKMLRESHKKGDSIEDDDLVRLQLETLLNEKARLAHENSIYARENRFLREIVEYHQLTMQDVVYMNEGIEEVSEVYHNPIPPLTPPFTISDPSTLFCPIPLTPSSTSSSVASFQQSPLGSSIIMPDDCPIVPTPPKLYTSAGKTGNQH